MVDCGFRINRQDAKIAKKMTERKPQGKTNSQRLETLLALLATWRIVFQI
jgi:hypothetical protein